MAALRAAVFPLSAKNRRGGHFFAPPLQCAYEANVNYNSYFFSSCAMSRLGVKKQVESQKVLCWALCCNCVVYK